MGHQSSISAIVLGKGATIFLATLDKHSIAAVEFAKNFVYNSMGCRDGNIVVD